MGEGIEKKSEMDKEKTEGDPQGQPLTLEQVSAELERVRKALKDANAEAAQRRKKLEEFEAEETKRKEAEKSELQKAVDKAAATEAKLAEQEKKTRQMAISHAVEITAAKLGFADPEDALSLIDQSSIKMDEGGKVEGVEDMLKDLLKRKPYLAKATQSGQQPTNINANNRPSGSGKTAEEILAEKRAQYPGL